MTCSVSGCRFIGAHKTTTTAIGLSKPMQIELCEYHWTLLQGEERYSMGTKVSIFTTRLKEIDGGRFSKLIDSLQVSDECLKCYYLNPKITDPGLGYRCHCIGSCIDATLSDEVKSFLLWKLNEITEEQHIRNMGAGKLLKIGK